MFDFRKSSPDPIPADRRSDISEFWSVRQNDNALTASEPLLRTASSDAMLRRRRRARTFLITVMGALLISIAIWALIIWVSVRLI